MRTSYKNKPIPMKRLIFSFIAIVATLFVACEKNDIVEDTNLDMVEIAIEANSLDVDDETRLSLNGNITKWELGDKINLILIVNNNKEAYATLEINSKSDIAADGKSAIFRGSVPAGSYNALTAVYPGVAQPSKSFTFDRNAQNNIYMTSYKQEAITIDSKTKSISLDFEHQMHKLDFNLSLASGYESQDLAANDIVVEMSARSNGSAVELWQTATYNATYNSVSAGNKSKSLSIATSGNASAKSLSFSTMIFPMNTMRDATFTFDIYINGQKCYEIKKPNEGTLSTFAMSKGKTTTINLELSMKNNVNSGLEKADITLAASKTTIKADGSDSVTLSVKRNDDNTDVTTESTIYVNGTKLNGTTFTTTNAGTYTLYAERNEVKSNEITITAEKVATGKTIVFAEGVSTSSGWYDVNKKGRGDNGDINMCWAAASSNMIQWWQDRYVAAGNKLPSTAITGPGTKSYDNFGPYELALMEIYHSNWDNSKGGHPEEAIPWYFEGKLYGGEYASAGSQATPKTSGGYWKSIWSSIEPYIYRGYSHDLFPNQYPAMYTYCYNNYSNWANGSGLEGQDRLKKFTQLVVQSFERGMAGLSVSTNSSLGMLHAVTLWGYEIDNSTGMLTRVWITDSDDLEKEPKTQLLNEYNVSIDSGKSHIKLSSSSTKYGAIWVASLHPFSGYRSAGK